MGSLHQSFLIIILALNNSVKNGIEPGESVPFHAFFSSVSYARGYSSLSLRAAPFVFPTVTERLSIKLNSFFAYAGKCEAIQHDEAGPRPFSSSAQP